MVAPAIPGLGVDEFVGGRGSIGAPTAAGA